jgi:hypothetical protein
MFCIFLDFSTYATHNCVKGQQTEKIGGSYSYHEKAYCYLREVREAVHANDGGAYYPESRRYVCKRCVDKQKSEQADREKARKAEERKAEADERERVTGMRQSKAAMLVKIVVGVLFLFAAVSLAVQGNISSFVCGLVIGGALVAWGLVPYLKAKSGRR